MTGVELTTLCTLKGTCYIRVRKDLAPESTVHVRIKSVRTGAIYEYVTSIVNGGGRSGPMIVVPKGAAGLEPGDEVAFRVSPVDIERWFDTNTSEPLGEVTP